MPYYQASVYVRTAICDRLIASSVEHPMGDSAIAAHCNAMRPDGTDKRKFVLEDVSVSTPTVSSETLMVLMATVLRS